MFSLKNYNFILKHIQFLSKKTTLIAVTKSQELSKINLLIETNHFHFGENRVQESIDKWSGILKLNSSIKLHLPDLNFMRPADKFLLLFILDNIFSPFFIIFF